MEVSTFEAEAGKAAKIGEDFDGALDSSVERLGCCLAPAASIIRMHRINS
jgi:hypothetical protein